MTMQTINRTIKGFPKATIKEDERFYYISLFKPTMLTQASIYDKSMFSLDEAIEMELEFLM